MIVLKWVNVALYDTDEFAISERFRFKRRISFTIARGDDWSTARMQSILLQFDRLSTYWRSDAESVTQFSTVDAWDSCFRNREWSVCFAHGDPDRLPPYVCIRDVFTGENYLSPSPLRIVLLRSFGNQLIMRFALNFYSQNLQLSKFLFSNCTITKTHIFIE